MNSSVINVFKEKNIGQMIYFGIMDELDTADVVNEKAFMRGNMDHIMDEFSELISANKVENLDIKGINLKHIVANAIENYLRDISQIEYVKIFVDEYSHDIMCDVVYDMKTQINPFNKIQLGSKRKRLE